MTTREQRRKEERKARKLNNNNRAVHRFDIGGGAQAAVFDRNSDFLDTVIKQMRLDEELHMNEAPRNETIAIPGTIYGVTRSICRFAKKMEPTGYSTWYKSANIRKILMSHEDLFLLVDEKGEAQILNFDRKVVATMRLPRNRNLWGQQYYLGVE
ncbi:hypothetical protein [Rothia terrae]|uniref:hypothetical protein n=1 Tax=Rothia terrae TaxID=396015 RepID=UPI002881210A|nr:hypothetical protein [Rothia terrae]MDT0189113.1 hypothetical protein [Rothia terrae]